MEKKVGFKLHKVKKNWVTIGVSTLSMVALAGGAFLTDQSAKADEVPVPNKGGYEQSDAGIESSASLVNQSYTPTLTEDATYVSAVPSRCGWPVLLSQDHKVEIVVGLSCLFAC